MDIQDLQTPAFLADLDVMENNLKRAADAALKYQKQIWDTLNTPSSSLSSSMTSFETAWFTLTNDSAFPSVFPLLHCMGEREPVRK